MSLTLTDISCIPQLLFSCFWCWIIISSSMRLNNILNGNSSFSFVLNVWKDVFNCHNFLNSLTDWHSCNSAFSAVRELQKYYTRSWYTATGLTGESAYFDSAGSWLPNYDAEWKFCFLCVSHCEFQLGYYL